MHHAPQVEFEGMASTPALEEYFHEQAAALGRLVAGMESCRIRVTSRPGRPNACRYLVRIAVSVGGTALDASQADDNLFVALRYACLSMRCRLAQARRRLRRPRLARPQAARR